LSKIDPKFTQKCVIKVQIWTKLFYLSDAIKFFLLNLFLGNFTVVLFFAGFLQKINGKQPHSLNLQKRFADPNLTIAELSKMVNDFIE
jgi:hypothetical protein